MREGTASKFPVPCSHACCDRPGWVSAGLRWALRLLQPSSPPAASAWAAPVTQARGCVRLPPTGLGSAEPALRPNGCDWVGLWSAPWFSLGSSPLLLSLCLCSAADCDLTPPPLPAPKAAAAAAPQHSCSRPFQGGGRGPSPALPMFGEPGPPCHAPAGLQADLFSPSSPSPPPPPQPQSVSESQADEKSPLTLGFSGLG